MKLVPENKLRELIINNNRIVCSIQILDDKYIPKDIKKEYECIILQFIHNGKDTLAVCEAINNGEHRSKYKKGDILIFKAIDLRFVYE